VNNIISLYKLEAYRGYLFSSGKKMAKYKFVISISAKSHFVISRKRTG